ncbi:MULTISPECIES: MFS transporter [Klebsiella]|uniref:MFS transporter n=1 Tax=Klebsiella TaxID=570 RepID=UPI000F513DFA|nr:MULTISPECIES: MFS transporter [Klebsiella]MBG2720182.1 MFS transporter [Klebsiella michiganensis]AYZ19033.1 MFS transporter [Klebsiella sp. FDAARGOS_511]MDV1905631.1 MFS transporter [Klebsiella pasteurii]MDV1911450.1 MFS transporter [Klebsiella pasteurii]QQO29133.1 MFS transporter [Klebsiella michiganensis]
MTYRSKVATVFLLGFFLDLINMFIASVAFPAMGRTLHASVGELAWVSNSYIAGLTLVLPFSAWLSQQFGARRVFLLSLTLFSLGALAAGMADSLISLVMWRALQGMGGGLLIPLGQALTWQQFKPHERAKLSAAVMLVGLLAPACSPALGGVLVQSLSWRWVFFASLPIALLTFGLAALWLRDEKSIARPGGFLHISLLRDPLLRFSMLVYLCVPGTFIGINVVGMFYLQSVTGMAPSTIGSLMLPWSLASFVAIATTGRYFNRLGPRPLIALGCLLQAAGIIILAGVNAHTASSALIAAFILMGAGGSLCSSTAQSSAFLNVANPDMPDASALWNLNRQLSFLIGSALLAALLSVFLLYWPTPLAWRGVFIAAAVLTLVPLLGCLKFDNRALVLRLHGKMENK